MRESFENIHRIEDMHGANPWRGSIVWSPVKSLFLLTMYGGAMAGCIAFLRWDAILLFAAKTATVLLIGHSVGMHRRLIHRSFDCPKWLEYGLVYAGTLVGLGGPFAMIRTHDFRDWAQRQPQCHDYFAHRQPPLIDAIWQMHCELRLQAPPRLNIEAEVADDSLYRWLDRHWILAHLPWAVAFFVIGGWAWVLWGVCAQVAVTVTGHWLIGYLAHADETRNWQVRGAGVQGRNVGFAGMITMGEAWHNNHHAFPGSARMGLYRGQSDPGYRFIRALEGLGLAWNVRLPEHLPHRPQLYWSGGQRRLRADSGPCPVLLRLRGKAV